MSADGFADIAGLVRRRAGIVLTDDKGYLLETRLAPVLAKLGLPSLGALGAKLRASPGEAVERAVVEALTTHESFFFRDGKPFEHLAALLPKLSAARGGQKLRVWSAACSSGQEAYSVAILALDAFGPQAAQRLEVVATDISGEVIAKAKQGVFTQFEVQRGLPIRSLVRHFAQAEGGRWRINDAVRALVRFEERNLLADCGGLGKFDAIFCRNVLIYFDAPTKTRVLEALAKQLVPDGVLYLGAAETVIGLTDRLQPVPGERGVYALAQRRAAA